MIVEEDEPADEDLTVETVQNAPMARNYVAKVLDAERTFETAREEAAKGSDEGDECANQNAVEEVGVPGYLANWNEELQKERWWGVVVENRLFGLV